MSKKKTGESPQKTQTVVMGADHRTRVLGDFLRRREGRFFFIPGQWLGTSLGQVRID
jgi:hypothetical protein